MKSINYLFLALIWCTIPLSAQQHGCGTDELLQERFKNSPGLEEQFHQHNLEKAKALQKKKSKQTSAKTTSTSTYEIPVIFHIIEATTRQPGDPGYISRERIEEGLNMLNEQLKYIDPTATNPIKQDMGIRFVLAKSDEQFNHTPAIYRYESEYTQLDFNDRNLMKSEVLENAQNINIRKGVTFDTEKYCNIYLVDEIIGDVVGFASLPLPGNKSKYDGIVFEAAYIGTTNDNTKVFTHEAGHYLGLAHTFNGHEDGKCNNETDCLAQGDFICDTPPDYTNSGYCNDKSPCPEHVGGQGNYMDYTGFHCMEFFTQGQADWMLATLENERETVSCNPSRISNPNHACEDPCNNPVVVNFEVLNNLQAGENLNFNNLTLNFGSNNTPTGYDYKWEMGDGTVNSTSNASPILHNYLWDGDYKITLTATSIDNNPACTKSVSKTLTISCDIDPQFSVNNELSGTKKVITVGESLTFQNQTPGIIQQEWYLDGILLGNNNSLTHTFNESGIFQLELRLFNGSCWESAGFYTIDAGNNCPGYTGLEEANWYFMKQGGGMTFINGKPEFLEGGTLINPTYNLNGIATISDQTGKFLFSTDGEHVYTRVNGVDELMAPANHNLKGNATVSRGVIIVPNPSPEKNYLYYIFTVSWNGPTPFYDYPEGLHYYVVDMRLNNGKGGLLPQYLNENDISLETVRLDRKIAAIKNLETNEFYIWTQTFEGEFIRYTLTENGLDINSRKTYNIPGMNLSRSGGAYISPMKFSKDGKIMATRFAGRHLHVFDVNLSNDSNPLSLRKIYPYNSDRLFEISPNGKYIYTASLGKEIFQINIETFEIKVVYKSNFTLQDLQLAKDGKIYVLLHNNNDQFLNQLVIQNPNAEGKNCIVTELNLPVPENSHLYTPLTYPTFVPNYNSNPININGPECVLPQTSNISLSTNITPLPNESISWSIVEDGINQTATITNFSQNEAFLEVHKEGLITVRMDYESPCGNTFAFHYITVSHTCGTPADCPDIDIKLTAPKHAIEGKNVNFQFELKSKNETPMDELFIEPIQENFDTYLSPTQTLINGKDDNFPYFVDYANMEVTNDGKILPITLSGRYETDVDRHIQQRFKIYTTDGCIYNDEDIKVPLSVKSNVVPPGFFWRPLNYIECDVPDEYSFFLEVTNIPDVHHFEFALRNPATANVFIDNVIANDFWEIDNLTWTPDGNDMIISGTASLREPETQVDLNYADDDGDLLLTTPPLTLKVGIIPDLVDIEFCNISSIKHEYLRFYSNDNTLIEEFGDYPSYTLPIPVRGEECGCTIMFADPDNTQTHFWEIRGNNVTYAGTTGWPSFYVNSDGELVKTDPTLGSPNGCTYELVSEITEGTANWQGELIEYGWMGESMTNLGDLNGDGTIDFAVNAGNDHVSNDGNSGRFWVLFMNEDGTIDHQVEVSRIRGGINDPLYQNPSYNVLYNNTQFAYSLDNIGDLDGDGVIDLVISEPQALGPEEYDPQSGEYKRFIHGRIWVLFMNSNGTVKSHKKIVRPNIPSGNEFFGSSVTKVGDIDGDGVVDIAVGDPLDYNSTNSYVGAVYIYFMNNDGSYKSFTRLSSNEGGLGVLPNSGQFGYSLTEIGDFDNDGTPDLMVGSFTAFNSTLDTPDQGLISILLLNTDGTVKHRIVYDQSVLAPLSVVGIGKSIYAYDVDYNGVKDILFGTYHQKTSSESQDSTSGPSYLNVAFLDYNGEVIGRERIDSPSDPSENFFGYDDFGSSIEMYENSNGEQTLMVAASRGNDFKGVLYKIKTGGCSPCTNPTTFYYDADGDGFGVEDNSYELCHAPVGYATVAGDCDDLDPNINPTAKEVCDGIDNNCDGNTDDTNVCLSECSSSVSFDNSNVCINQSSSFWNNSTDYTYNSFEWFVDGISVGNGNSINYTLNQTGQHHIQMVASSSSDVCVVTKTVDIPVFGPIYAPESVCSGETGVKVSVNSSLIGASHNWNAYSMTTNINNYGKTAYLDFGTNIGNGEIRVTADQNGCTYEAVAPLPVGGCSDDNPGCSLADVAMWYTHKCGTKIEYYNGSDEEFDSFEWFVDGIKVSSGRHLDYEFAELGTYEVKLVGHSSSLGCSKEVRETITATGFGTITGPTELCVQGDTLEFSVSNFTYGVTYEWYSNDITINNVHQFGYSNASIAFSSTNLPVGSTITLYVDKNYQNCTYQDKYDLTLVDCNENGGGSGTGCNQEVTLSASDWTLKNDWNDAAQGSSITNGTNGLDISHRTWGQNYFWLTKEVGAFALEAGKTYQVEFEYKESDQAATNTNALEVTFAGSTSWNGPAVTETVYSTTTNLNTGTFNLIQAPLNVSANGNYLLAIKASLSNQPPSVTEFGIRNLKLCEINPSQKVAFQATPNPFENEVDIDVAVEGMEQDDYQLTVINAQGSIVYERQMFGHSQITLGDNFPPGLYLVHINTGDQVEVYKLVKQ